MKIILDTNFLVYCAKKKIDYAEEISSLVNEDYEIVVPLQVLSELEKLKEKAKKLKDKDAAKLALQILEARKIKKIKAAGETADEAILSLAKEDKNNIVCTLDKEMRKKLGKVILIRGKRLILAK